MPKSTKEYVLCSQQNFLVVCGSLPEEKRAGEKRYRSDAGLFLDLNKKGLKTTGVIKLSF